MRKIYILAGLLFLASCGNPEVSESTQVKVPTTPETVVVQTIEVDAEDEDEWEDNEESDDSESVAKPEDAATVLEEEEEEEEVETPDEEINDEVAALETAVEDSSKTVTLDAAYTNPKGPVDMTVTYSTDSTGVITALNVAATTYDVSEFNTEVQKLVGSTLEEASEYTSGSSLTGYAFTQAVKAELK